MGFKKALARGFLLLAICPAFNAASQSPFITNYTSFDGLPSNNVYQVYQDSQKFIWFATDAGVARYDGSGFTYFTRHDGINSNDVVRIKQDSTGRIWFFNMDASLNFYYDGIIYNSSNAPFLDSLITRELFRNFFEDADHTLYFYFNHQREIFTLDSLNQVKKHRFPSQMRYYPGAGRVIDGMDIRHLERASDGWLYMWTIAGLYKFSTFPDKYELVPDSINYKSVFSEKGEGRFIVIKGKGNYKYDIWKLDDEIRVDFSSTPIGTNTEFVSSVFEDDAGLIWVSTFDQGVTCYSGNEPVRHFDIIDAQSIIQDHEGNIWVSSLKDGAYKISPILHKRVHYDRSHFNYREVLNLSKHITNGIWMTNGSQVFLLKNDSISMLDFQQEQSNLNQIIQIDDNTLLVGALSTPHFLIEGIGPGTNRGEIGFTGLKKSPRSFKKLTSNTDASEILTWNFFTVIRMRPRLFENVTYFEAGERVYNVFNNSEGEIVVNTRGIFYLRNDSLVPVQSLSSFNGRIISDHLVIEDSIDVFNLENDSIYIQDGENLLNLTARWGFPGDLQIKHLEYHSPNLYLASSRKIYFCENPVKAFRGEPVELKMLDITFRNIHDILYQDDNLYIASDFGLTVISIASFEGSGISPPFPYFHSLVINGEEIPGDTGEIVLTGQNKILITLGSINLTSSSTIFSYMLEGLDENWQTGRSNNVVYESLPKGYYVFRLRTRKPTSVWSDPIDLRIRIRATIWQQPLFYAFIFLLLTAIVIVVIVWRKNEEIKRREIEHQLLLLEQRALQSMMNPHFIFNSLGSVQNYLLQNKSIEAVHYLSQFARLIRQNLNSSSSAMISLTEEIDRLNNYLELENLRMEKKFEFAIEVDESIRPHLTFIPSMVIQPFVENAIWHGISVIGITGVIRIRFLPNGSRTISICIEDNGKGMHVKDEGQSRSTRHRAMGMAMTRKRLEILGKKYKVSTGITITDIQPGDPLPGTRVEIVVPFASGAEKQPI